MIRHILGNCKLGQLKDGVQKAPRMITDNLHINNKPLNYLIDFKDKSDYTKLYTLNSNSLFNQNKVINFGGDHSISIATLQATIDVFPTTKVIWIDAHPDCNTYESSITKNLHGMVLSQIFGLNKLLNFGYNKLDFKDIMYVGIRELDLFEKELIESNNINYITVDEINMNPEKTAKKIMEFVDNKPVHLSFDVDSLDPKYISSTGTPVINGIDYLSINLLLSNLKLKNLKNADIVEFNPNLAINDYKLYMELDIMRSIYNLIHKIMKND
jgi:arginase